MQLKRRCIAIEVDNYQFFHGKVRGVSQLASSTEVSDHVGDGEVSETCSDRVGDREVSETCCETEVAASDVTEPQAETET